MTKIWLPPQWQQHRMIRSWRHGDVQIGTGHFSADGSDATPALFVAQWHAPVKPGIYVIPLANAWEWREPQAVAKRALDIAEKIGMSADLHTCHRIITAVMDHLDDLVGMKPVEETRKPMIGEARVNIDGYELNAGVTA